MLHKGGDISYRTTCWCVWCLDPDSQTNFPMNKSRIVLLLTFGMNSFSFSLWMTVYGHKIDTILLRNAQDCSI